jgi:hypothetical protein
LRTALSNLSASVLPGTWGAGAGFITHNHTSKNQMATPPLIILSLVSVAFLGVAIIAGFVGDRFGQGWLAFGAAGTSSLNCLLFKASGSDNEVYIAGIGICAFTQMIIWGACSRRTPLSSNSLASLVTRLGRITSPDMKHK